MAATEGISTIGEAKYPDVENLRLIEELNSNVDAVQERVLAEILGRNAGAEYLNKCGLDAGNKVPVVTWCPVRQARCQRRPFAHLVNTPPSPGSSPARSGTSTGERKLPIVTDEIARREVLSLMVHSFHGYVPGLDMGKVLYLTFVESETKTPGGLTAQPALTSVYKSEHFKRRANAYTSPMATILCEDASQISMYAQMLCGLCQHHDVLPVGAVFAAALVRAISFLQLNWAQLAADIEAGELNPRVTNPSVREALAGILRPHAELAEFMRTECSRGDWTGIVSRVWPNTK
uniref:Uncharacterized protein n=1 Tax=Oryza punctata TaxID=4537 RepID=A0A0E0LMK8_ORYPU